MTTESMKDSPSDAEKYGGFGIMGYFTGQETFDNVKNTVTAGYMYNQAVEYDSKTSAWTYSPVKYWPNRDGDKISFFAYAPYERQRAKRYQNGNNYFRCYRSRNSLH